MTNTVPHSKFHGVEMPELLCSICDIVFMGVRSTTKIDLGNLVKPGSRFTLWQKRVKIMVTGPTENKPNIRNCGFSSNDKFSKCYLLNARLHVAHLSWAHDDVIRWKHLPRYWPFVRGNHRSPVISPHKGQWGWALMLSLICVWINSWVNNREAGDLRRYCAHYDVIVMTWFDIVFRPIPWAENENQRVKTICSSNHMIVKEIKKVNDYKY